MFSREHAPFWLATKNVILSFKMKTNMQYGLAKTALKYLLILLKTAVFRRTWTDAEELLKEKSFFILSFVFLSKFVIRQVQTNIF